jgi:hypothetical protein
MSEDRHKKTIEQLTRIGSALHSHNRALATIGNTINAILQSFQSDPFKETPNLLPAQASAELEGPARRLAETVKRLIDNIVESDPRGSSSRDLHRLSELVELLQNYHQRVRYPEFYAAVLRTDALQIREILARLSRAIRRREDLVAATKHGQELLQICNLISLHHLLDVTEEMDDQLCALRQFLMTGERETVRLHRQHEKQSPVD